MDLTKIPEFMDALTQAIAAAAAELATPKTGAADDPEHIWLTTKEAAAFFHMAVSSFRQFKRRPEISRDLVVSHRIGDSEPRYQLASCRRLMLQEAVGLPEELPGMNLPSSNKPNGKRRDVTLRPAGHR